MEAPPLLFTATAVRGRGSPASLAAYSSSSPKDGTRGGGEHPPIYCPPVAAGSLAALLPVRVLRSPHLVTKGSGSAVR